MQIFFKKQGLLLSLIALCNSSVIADINTESDIVFDWAELTYLELFSPASTTEFIGEWRYRYYSKTDNYIGVNNNEKVAVLGNQFGEGIVFVGTVSEFLEKINIRNNLTQNISTNRGSE